MCKRLVFSWLLFLSSCFCLGQNRDIDSVQNLLGKDKEDTNKVNHLNRLSREYLETGNHAAALSYVQNAKKLAEKTNFQKGLAYAYNNTGIIYNDQGNYLEALKNHFV